MSVISIETALLHLRVDEDADKPLIQAQLDAAEESASQYLQRRFYADQASLDAALATVPGAVNASRVRYEQALAAADLVVDYGDRQAALDRAQLSFARQRGDIESIAAGMVITPAIQAAVLLTLGHLYANREDVVLVSNIYELPFNSRQLLNPYRVRMGV